MNSERWEQINELFLAALERAPSERTAFVSEATTNDEELRREVESLLASHEAASKFIEEPLVGEGARLLADDNRQSMVGRQIGHYRILSLLGSGGMGDVYLAEDSRLGRQVAIKILPLQFSQDRDRVRRLQQEARAASALNHPNILTIHEIGEFEGRTFIATEFIDGETLRRRLAEGALNVGEALDLASQIASALAKAHAAGIAHRDIKPDNIMINRDGYAKVLDFGLAKLTEREARLDPEAPTKALVNTEPGMVMGTAHYMSPEQARGSTVDTLTDLWSLGVVLYQMLSGRLPFEGTTPTEVIARVLEREPQSLDEFVPDLPLEMQHVVEKALTKERDERYQTATEMLTDLKSVRKQFESGQLKYRSGAGISGGERVTGAARLTATGVAGPRGTDKAAAVPTSSAEYIVTEIKRHKTGVTLALALVVVGVAGLGWGLFKLIQNRSSKSMSSFERMKVTKLTTAGKIQSEPAISPDGKYVAYATLDRDKQSLWITHVATNSNIQLIGPGDFGYWAVTFSPDGNYIYYHLKERNGSTGLVVYQIPVLGGQSRKIIEDVNSNITFSPDGKRFAFNRDAEESMIVIANADGSGQQTIARRKKTDGFFTIPSWSPDGLLIACAISGPGSSRQSSEMVIIRVADGLETTTMLPKDLLASSFSVWLPDGSGLLVTATSGAVNQDINFFNQVWFVSYPSGEAHRITNDLNSYAGLSLTADGSTLVTAQSEYHSSIWASTNNDFGRAKQIIPGAYDGVMGLSWTPDRKIVYAAVIGGKWDLFTANADGSNRKQLTSNPGNNVFPVVTPDGHYVVFNSDQTGKYNLWRIDSDGSNQKQLTFGSGEAVPKCSADGQWIYYRDGNVGRITISKISINGGDPVRLFNDRSVAWIAPSPDGQLIAFVAIDERSRRTLYVSPPEGWSAARELSNSAGPLVWSPDGKALTYNTFFNDLGTTTSKVWSQSLDGGPPKLLFDASPDHVFYYDWSRDGKQLAFARGSLTQDIVLISNFR